MTDGKDSFRISGNTAYDIPGYSTVACLYNFEGHYVHAVDI